MVPFPTLVGRTHREGLPTASRVAVGTVSAARPGATARWSRCRRWRALAGPAARRGEVRGRRGRRVGVPGGLDHDHGGDGGHHQSDRDQGRQHRVAGAEAGGWRRGLGPGLALGAGAAGSGLAGSVRLGLAWCSWMRLVVGRGGRDGPDGDFDMCVLLGLDRARRQGARARRLETEAGEAGLPDCMQATPGAGRPRDGAAAARASPSAVRARRTAAGGTGGPARPAGRVRTRPRRRRTRRPPPRRPPSPPRPPPG